MRKLLALLLLLISLLPLTAAELNSNFDLSLGSTFMRSKIYTDTLNARSSLSAELRITPFLIGSEKLKGGLYLNGVYTTPTFIYQSTRYDGSLKGGFGASLYYTFTNAISAELSAGTSLGYFVLSKDECASIDASLAIEAHPFQFLSLISRATLSFESDRTSLAFKVGARFTLERDI